MVLRTCRGFKSRDAAVLEAATPGSTPGSCCCLLPPQLVGFIIVPLHRISTTPSASSASESWPFTFCPADLPVTCRLPLASPTARSTGERPALTGATCRSPPSVVHHRHAIYIIVMILFSTSSSPGIIATRPGTDHLRRRQSAPTPARHRHMAAARLWPKQRRHRQGRGNILKQLSSPERW